VFGNCLVNLEEELRMFEPSSFQSARAAAEEAVADMKDRDLRTAAFTVLLTELLSRGAIYAPAKPNARPEPVRRPNRRTTPTAPVNTSARAESKKSRLLALRDEGFFKAQRGLRETREELRKHGWHYPLSALSGPMQGLVRERALRRERVSVGAGKKRVWKYSNP
jgi:hypothetical protein